jgi:hypothetical protein
MIDQKQLENVEYFKYLDSIHELRFLEFGIDIQKRGSFFYTVVLAQPFCQDVCHQEKASSWIHTPTSL